MPKQILVVVDSIDVNDSSGSKANVALINNLAAIGSNLIVFHYTQKNIHIEGVKCIAIKELKFTLFYFLSRIQRIIQRNLKLNFAKYFEPIFGFSFTFFNDINSIKAVLKKQNVSNVAMVITLSKGASFRPHYAVNKLPQLHKKWLAYIHDPYPFVCYPPPYDWKEPGYKQKVAFFKNVSENAQYAAFPSLLLKNWMGTYFENFNKRGIVIPHQIIKSESKALLLPNFFDISKFNILHAGSLMKQRDSVGLIKGFQKFINNNPDAYKDSKLILLGSADYHKSLIESYAERIPQLYINLSNISFEEVLNLQKHVSINIILEADAESSPFLPGKFPHCIEANKIILHLGPEKSETRRLLGINYPFVAKINDVDAISKILQDLYCKWQESHENMTLNRPDLYNYLGTEYLKEQLELALKND